MIKDLPPLRLSKFSRQWVQAVTPKEPAATKRELYIPAEKVRELALQWSIFSNSYHRKCCAQLEQLIADCETEADAG